MPTANFEPEASEYVIVTPLTASVAVAAGVVTTVPDELVVVTVMSGLIEVIAGGVVSRTVTVKVFWRRFPRSPSR